MTVLKKTVVTGSVAVVSSVVAYWILRKKKKKDTAIRPIKPVNPKDAGFEEYGYLKEFHFDKSACKKVLITGADSYIGGTFKEYCKELYPNIYCTEIDMIDGMWRDKDFSQYDTVFHVAGIAHADIGNTTEEEQEKYYKVNTDLAIETARKAKDDGVSQFIFMSSMIIYGTQEFIDEHTVPSPTNFYGNSKWLADKGVRELADDGFHVAVLRPPMIYGNGSKGNYPKLVRIAGITPIFPKTDNKRSMLYVGNLCEFVAELTLSGEGGVYFPQNEELCSTSEIVKMIGEAKGRKIRLCKALGQFVAISQKIPGKVGNMAAKAFGNNFYDKGLSKYYGMDYQKTRVKESITLSIL